MDHVAVFGVGSTNFRAGVAAADGTFVTDVRIEPTRPEELGAQLRTALEACRSGTSVDIDAVGVSTAGLVDGGVVQSFDTPAGETVGPIDVPAVVRSVGEWPVVVENDCTAAVLGEVHYGDGGGEESVVHVTIGTGIGAGVVEGGRLLRGARGQAGEFGLVPVVADGRLASTGVTGAWEAYCSGRGIPRYVSERISREGPETSLAGDADGLTAPDVFAAAEEGDDFAQDCLSTLARYNAAGIGALCNAVYPGLVTFGGGVARNNEAWLLDGLDRHLEEFLFVDRPELRMSRLADEIGLYGALAAALSS